MRAFIDTSSLFKKYVEEDGTHEFNHLLEKISEIIVSPTCWIELHAIIFRLLREKKIGLKDADWLQKEIKRDFHFFSKILWNDNLENETANLVTKNSLKTLDSIQLAAGRLSNSDIFITSDRKLFTEAKKVLKDALLI